MSDKVISLRSRKPLEETIAEEKKEAEEAENASIKATLEWFDKLRPAIAAGRLQGICILARDPQSTLFFTDIMFPGRQILPHEAIEYIGYLELLKLEMSDVASMVPVITAEGDVIDPSAEPEDIEE